MGPAGKLPSTGPGPSTVTIGVAEIESQAYGVVSRLIKPQLGRWQRVSGNAPNRHEDQKDALSNGLSAMNLATKLLYPTDNC
jgi:hypothetical protein